MFIVSFTVGNMAIVTSDGEGLISAFSPYTDLWSLRLTDLRQLKVDLCIFNT